MTVKGRDSPVPTTRIYVRENLQSAAGLTLDHRASHYLAHVLRVKVGDTIALFNGRDGEWLADVTHIGKKEVAVQVGEQSAPPTPCADLWLAFAPVKNEKIDYTARRATELGVSRLIPVMTQHTIVSRVNTERLRANVIEAAEQCGRLNVPEVDEPIKLYALLDGWDASRTLIHCDEAGAGLPVKNLLPTLPKGAYAVLIGPEGGFSEAERGNLQKRPYIKALSLGPRILRAETAALAALANIQAWVGDWD